MTVNIGQGFVQSLIFYELKKEISEVEKQVKIPIVYDGIKLDADLRLDIWVRKKLIVEVKSVETLLPVHQAQLLT